MSALETTAAATQPQLRPLPTARVFAALVRRGIRDRRRAPLTWGGSVGAMSALIVAIWPSIEDSISKAVQGYPEGLKAAFGISELNSAAAYLDAEMFSLIVPLTVGFFAVRVIVGAIPSAEENGDLDTLLTAPVSRRVLVAAAFAVAGTMSAAILAVVGGASLLASVLTGSGLPFGRTLAALAMVWALAMLFAGLAAAATGVLRSAGAVTAVSIGTLVAMYVVDIAGKIAHDLEPVRWASAFKYYDSPLKDGFDVLAFAGLTLVGAALVALGARLFERRDVL